jgi:hypothetical protein
MDPTQAGFDRSRHQQGCVRAHPVVPVGLDLDVNPGCDLGAGHLWVVGHEVPDDALS